MITDAAEPLWQALTSKKAEQLVTELRRAAPLQMSMFPAPVVRRDPTQTPNPHTCWQPDKCAGLSSCPRSLACTE